MIGQNVRAVALANTPENVLTWMAEIATLAASDVVESCDDSQEERDRLTTLVVENDTFTKLNGEKCPNSFLARSKPSGVTRVESRTFIRSEKEEDAGPTNRWADPKEMKAVLREKLASSIIGRTLYMIPFSMDPPGGPISQFGVEITDSPCVVYSMRIMTRMGTVTMDPIAEDKPWVPVVYSVGIPLAEGTVDNSWPCNDGKYVIHLPGTNGIWSFGSDYGGNVLLGKKCLALRTASTMARRNGWMTEHMLTLRLTCQETDQQFHVTATSLSACGRTSLAMLQPTIPGYNIGAVGDDIAWTRPGPDGRLYTINLEVGFFGVTPGTSYDTNLMTMDTMRADSIFINVALTDDGDVWWEGIGGEVPAHFIDQLSRDWTLKPGEKAAHPNSRFTVSTSQCLITCPNWETPQGVPVNAIFFDERCATNVSLVAEQYETAHGVFIGASVTFEITAATTDVKAGLLCHDFFTMFPFCDYHVAGYWDHWPETQAEVGDKFPKVYQVNRFRKDENGEFMWSGYDDNSRVFDQIIRRAVGEVEAIDGTTGRCPEFEDFNLDGLDIDEAVWAKLFEIDLSAWIVEMDGIEGYFAQFGDKLPVAITEQPVKFRAYIEAAHA